MRNHESSIYRQRGPVWEIRLKIIGIARRVLKSVMQQVRCAIAAAREENRQPAEKTDGTIQPRFAEEGNRPTAPSCMKRQRIQDEPNDNPAEAAGPTVNGN